MRDYYKKEQKPVNIPLPNVALFLIMAIAFVLIGMVVFEKHIDFEDLDTGSVVAMSLSLVFGIMFVSALIYNVDFLKPKKRP